MKLAALLLCLALPLAAQRPAPRRIEFRTRPWFAQNARKVRGGHTSGTGIYYHGGPVLGAGTRVAAVYWANGAIYRGGPQPGAFGPGADDGSLVGAFLRGLGGSPYYAINTTYTDQGGLAVANRVDYTQFWAADVGVPAPGAVASDADMLALLEQGFATGRLVYDAGTVYAVFTAGSVNLGGGFGSQYCAYHSWGSVTVAGRSVTVLYAAMPYDWYRADVCSSGAAPANGAYDPAADAEVSTLAHELEEAATDALGSAWYDRNGYENADKCAWTYGATYQTAAGGVANMRVGGYDFLVQRNWANAGPGGCYVAWP
jgi:hypothetical protein